VLNVHALFHGSMRRQPAENTPPERREKELRDAPQVSVPKHANLPTGPARRLGADSQMSQRVA
jgi:hypothetical protein